WYASSDSKRDFVSCSDSSTLASISLESLGDNVTPCRLASPTSSLKSISWLSTCVRSVSSIDESGRACAWLRNRYSCSSTSLSRITSSLTTAAMPSRRSDEAGGRPVDGFGRAGVLDGAVDAGAGAGVVDLGAGAGAAFAKGATARNRSRAAGRTMCFKVENLPYANRDIAAVDRNVTRRARWTHTAGERRSSMPSVNGYSK